MMAHDERELEAYIEEQHRQMVEASGLSLEEFDRQEEERYEAHLLEEASVRINGLSQCHECGEYSLHTTSRRTRQYGGGWDTYIECVNPECRHADIFV